MATDPPAVRQDCRHYLARSTPSGEVVQRCRVGANSQDPFACPDGCLFFEGRSLSAAGWAQAPAQPMSNTADGLIDLPPAKRKKPRKRR
ncbi:hypothetical protein K6U06_21280 [Acidiferrimicrobium sp. IK]|uniref:hypothetical protein n=1 Tax=Acidiferrimicrobium sp. IK TaxID=2871700 RepID=UPI0021CB6419|nr:hypothetical protein [Acidiferrimicrobium sp. IK]MCU4186912.1 hypothetical protein [Acidiferrimicrobium sp. IK]